MNLEDILYMINLMKDEMTETQAKNLKYLLNNYKSINVNITKNNTMTISCFRGDNNFFKLIMIKED